jgi:hypothetical protein
MLLLALATVGVVSATNGTLDNPCAPWDTCELCTSTSVCQTGIGCIYCGWCPSDSGCYVNTIDCTSWVAYNKTDKCPPTTPFLATPATDSLFWKVQKVVMMALGGLFAVLGMVFILTCVGLRGRPRDFDSIMVDELDNSEDRGYTSPAMARR